MDHRFWETMLSFEREAAQLTRTLVRSRAQMRGLHSQTAGIIAESRALMGKVDELIAGDPWCEQSRRKRRFRKPQERQPLCRVLNT